MAYPVSDQYREVLKGSFHLQYQASVLYDGEIVADLPVLLGTSLSADGANGSAARADLEIKVLDEDHSLWYRDVTAPLAAFGQEIVLWCEISVPSMAGTWSETIPMGTYRIVDPGNDTSSPPPWTWRARYAGGVSDKLQWRPDPNGRSMMSDLGVYEAFPTAATNASGLTLAHWNANVNHYTKGRSLGATLAPGETAWSPAFDIAGLDGGYGPGPLAVRGDTFASLEMVGATRTSRIRFSTDGRNWTAGKPVIWTQLPTAFACGLTWASDGTLYALAYSNYVTEITRSTDGGNSWATCWREVDARRTECALLERDGTLYLYQRYESGADRHMSVRWSNDGGLTFTAPRVAIRDSLGLPLPTAMPDGTILMPVRDTSAGDWRWAYAYSTDAVTWTKRPLFLGNNLYGQFAPRGVDQALLIGSWEYDQGNAPSSSKNTRAVIFQWPFSARLAAGADVAPGSVEWRQSGEILSVKAQDRITTTVSMNGMVGAATSKPSGTVRSESTRLIDGMIPMGDWTSRVVVPTSTWQGRVDALVAIADFDGLVPWINRSGAYEPRSMNRKAEPDWTITSANPLTGEGGLLLSAAASGVVDGLPNFVIVTGETKGDNPKPTQGSSRITSGPLRYGGPYGWVTKEFQNPLATSNQLAQKIAATMLDKELSRITVPVTVRHIPNPAMDLFDTVQVDAPDGTVVGVVQAIKYASDATGVQETTLALSWKDVWNVSA